jgi:tRNA A37 threonylcarbamoyladenosine biosynthesis protein TsaE
LQPDGVTVIEWAERLSEDRRRKPDTGKIWLRVKIEIIGETERKIIYDDSGA